MNNKMIKLAACVFLAALSIDSVEAQNGFGTKQPSEATMLEIQSTDKGILIPRVSLTRLNNFGPITGANSTEASKVNSLLVYNLTSDPANNLAPGYYYWTTDGTNGSWNRIATGTDAKTMPWFLANTTDEATLNTQNIYQSGNVGIGNFTTQLPTEKLDIETGNLRVRDIFNSSGDKATDKVVTSDNTGVLSSLTVQDVNILTSIELETVTDGEVDENGEPIPGIVTSTYTLKYKDELGADTSISMNALIEAAETLTSLTYDGGLHQLIYTDEDGLKTVYDLVDLVGDVQTLTTLSLDIDNKRLIYTDENEDVHSLNLAPIIQEPWYNVATNTGATSNTDNIYTQGWVGIGYTAPSSAPNEKLRVNGAITAVNNYYADYVFEDYFEGFSEIKSDYKFKSLEEIDNYIQVNKHLPGITPITKLEKTDEGYAFNVSELSIQLLEKTEELYLHTIEQENQINAQNKQIKELQDKLNQLEQLINSK